MRILGIETSCDETAASLVENGTKILSSVVASSKTLHEKTGGIIPEIAAREQIKCIIPVINEALQQQTKNKNQQNRSLSADCSFYSDIDAIAVTVGPGLIGSLLVGVETAKTIALAIKKPMIPVNHIFAHIYANWLINSGSDLKGVKGLILSTPHIPAIVLAVSGGHTELFYMKDHGEFKWLGGTRDDAAGEAFDKTARLLGLGFPGGPAIAVEAAKIRNPKSLPAQVGEIRNKIKLPRPMIEEKNLDFSFSGLKTAVIRETNRLKAIKQFNNRTIEQLAYEIQEAITDVLVSKTLRAAKQYKTKSILLGGGVAANKRLREKFKLKIENLKLKINLSIPPPSLCTDNAACVAAFAYFNYQPVPWQKIQAQPDLEVEV